MDTHCIWSVPAGTSRSPPVAQKAGTWTGDLPNEADGPYLVLRDLGYDLERRVPAAWQEAESSLKHTSSLLADYSTPVSMTRMGFLPTAKTVSGNCGRRI